jgi:predicted RNA-binding Zn-ribbon protein involved in translation (DUF1610 family)
MNLGTIIVICLVFGAITAAIAQKKNISVGEWFVIGALLGIFGVLIVLLQRPRLPKAPPGMQVMRCPRCNAIQNVPETQSAYECWQCKATHRLWGQEPQLELAGPRGNEHPASRDTKPAASMGKDKVRCHKCHHVQEVPADLSLFVCDECGARLKRRAASA